MKTYELLVVVMCAVAPALAYAQIPPTWSAAPDPTGTCHSAPDLVTLDKQVTFNMLDLQDFDTMTTITVTGRTCTSTQTLVADANLNGEWQVTRPGDSGVCVYDGVSVAFNTLAWLWSPNGTDTGSTADILGGFIFDDHRSDARHDYKMLCSALSTEVIPDRVTTTVIGPDRPPPPNDFVQAGTYFNQQVTNDAFPMSFQGVQVGEEVVYVLFDKVYNRDVADLITNGWKDTWTVNDNGYMCGDSTGNCFDKHSAWPPEFLFRDGNTTVWVVQQYKILTAGWRGMNPNHHIGAQGGIGGGLSGNHWITFQYASATCIKVTKDGVGCDCPS